MGLVLKGGAPSLLKVALEEDLGLILLKIVSCSLSFFALMPVGAIKC